MSGSFSVDNNYDRYEYYTQQRAEEIEQEKQEEESVFNKTEPEYYETTETSDDLEGLQNTYNLYLKAQEEDFTYETNEIEDKKEENIKTFKEGVETNDKGEAKVSVVKWTGDSSENSSLFGIVRNHYNLDEVRKANPELKDYSDEDMRFYISEKIAEMNGIADINVIEIGQELTLPSLAPKAPKTDGSDDTNVDVPETDDKDIDGDELLAKLQSAGGDAWNEFDRLASTLGLSKDKAAEYLENLCSTVGENCIDPVIFTALLRQESGYRRDAVGDGGLAIGLGQLQPIAVEQLNQWYPEKNYSNDDRYDAYKNLEMTMMCIKGHYNEYVNAYGTKPSVRTLLGAYNQGWITLAENSGGVQYAKDVLSRLNSYSV